MAIFMSSDLHFNHNKDFVWKVRGFNSVKEMNEAIIKRFNSKVEPDDHLYILGDLMLGNNKAGIELIKKLNGRIHIVLGNHDTDTRIEEYHLLPNVVDVQFAGRLKYGKYNFYLSHYPTLVGNYDDKGPRSTMLNLYGHTHQTTPFGPQWNMYNVGVDAHDCYPVLLDDIIEEIKIEYERVRGEN